MSSCHNRKKIQIGLCHNCDKVTLFLGDISLKLDTDSFLEHATVVKAAEGKILERKEKVEKKRKLKGNNFLSLLKV